MTSTLDLETILARTNPWQICYPAVAQIIKATLTAHKGDPITSTALAEMIWPLAKVKTAQQKSCRVRLFKAMRVVSERELATWHRATGESQLFMGRKIDIFRWFDPNKSPTGATTTDKLRALTDAALACVGEIRRVRPLLEENRSQYHVPIDTLDSVLQRLEKAISL